MLTFRFKRYVSFAGAILATGIWLATIIAGFAATNPHESDELFTNSAIRHLRIEISKENVEALRPYTWRTRKDLPRISVPATVREGTLVWTNVAVHLKGAYGSFRPLDDKPGLTLNFDKLADGQRFHGLQKISLNNSVQNPSFVSEHIARELHNRAGVPTPRVDYATVELNGRKLGLYVLVEGWNKQFLKRHFPNVKGNFYDFGGSHDIDKPTPAAFGLEPTNHSALAALVAATKEKDPARRIAEMRKTVDLDRFLSMIAIDTLVWNWDGYANNKNNYRTFVDLDKNRVVFFPHGIDMTFSKPDAPIVSGRAGLVAKALLEIEEGRQLYLDRLRELRTNVFNVPAIFKRIDELNARLEPVLEKDGTLGRQQNSVKWYRLLVLARERDVDAQLAGVKELLRLEQNAKSSITNWLPGSEIGGVVIDKTAPDSPALHLKVTEATAVASWNATLWLEEGRYRLQARIRTRDIRPQADSTNSGAGLRVWTARKASAGSSWSWSPLQAARDPHARGVIPVMTNTVQRRLTGDNDWTTITHEFELRQPIADLQIQCAIENATGEAWFDAASLQIQRRSRNVSKPTLARKPVSSTTTSRNND
jgi:spore coat protein H